MRVLGIAGSLRRDSHNAKLLRAAADVLPPEVEFVVWDELKSVPPFDQDDEAGPEAPAVASLRNALREADAVLFATPEYNSSVPGVLKNAVDWASRPANAAALRNLPVAVVGASPGMFGAVWAQADLRKSLAAAGARVIDRELAVPAAHEQFDAAGALLDSDLRAALGDILAELTDAARRRHERVAA